jgi:hypothetical protein
MDQSQPSWFVVCLVCLVCLVGLVERDQPDEPDRRDSQDEPDRPKKPAASDVIPSQSKGIQSSAENFIDMATSSSPSHSLHANKSDG